MIVKLKRKLEYRGHVLFEAIRPDFSHSVLSYLKPNNQFYKGIVVRDDLEEVIPQIDCNPGDTRRQSRNLNEESAFLSKVFIFIKCYH